MQNKENLDKDGSVQLTIANGETVTLAKEFLTIEQLEKTIQEEKYTPNVIEPSYGIGRIVYCIFEHCFKVRKEDAQRTYFDFPPLISPVKCSLLPLLDNDDLNKVVQDISKFFNNKHRALADQGEHLLEDRRLRPVDWKEVCAN